MSTINPFEILESKMDQVLEAQRATQRMLAGDKPEEASDKPMNLRRQ